MESLGLINKFWKLHEEHIFDNASILLYFYLLNVWENNSNNDFELSDRVLDQKIKLSRNTIFKAKENLRNLGLISYQFRKGTPTFYKIITDYKFKGKVIPAEKEETIEIPKAKIPTQQPTIPIPQVPIVPPTTETSKEKPKETPKKEVPSIPTKETPKTKTTVPTVPVPSLEEFIEFAKTLEVYSEDLLFALKAKYEQWNESNWINGFNKPILNWKSALKNSILHLGKTQNNVSIPKISRPKTTYNE